MEATSMSNKRRAFVELACRVMGGSDLNDMRAFLLCQSKWNQPGQDHTDLLELWASELAEAALRKKDAEGRKIPSTKVEDREQNVLDFMRLWISEYPQDFRSVQHRTFVLRELDRSCSDSTVINNFKLLFLQVADRRTAKVQISANHTPKKNEKEIPAPEEGAVETNKTPKEDEEAQACTVSSYSHILSQFHVGTYRNLWEGLSPSIIANEFTRQEALMFLAVPPREWLAYSANSSSADATGKLQRLCPHLFPYIERFNQVSYWTVTMILSHDEPKAMADCIKRFIKIANCCRKRNNFNSVMQIVGALNNRCISRLKEAWKEVSPSSRARFTELDKLGDPHSNFKHYREAFEKAKRHHHTPPSGGSMALRDSIAQAATGPSSGLEKMSRQTRSSPALMLHNLEGDEKADGGGNKKKVAPRIPYVAIILRDLTFTDVGNTDYTQQQQKEQPQTEEAGESKREEGEPSVEDGRINKEKMLMLYMLIKWVCKLQEKAAQLELECEGIGTSEIRQRAQAFLKALPAIRNDKILDQLSMLAQPKTGQPRGVKREAQQEASSSSASVSSRQVKLVTEGDKEDDTDDEEEEPASNDEEVLSPEMRRRTMSTAELGRWRRIAMDALEEQPYKKEKQKKKQKQKRKDNHKTEGRASNKATKASHQTNVPPTIQLVSSGMANTNLPSNNNSSGVRGTRSISTGDLHVLRGEAPPPNRGGLYTIDSGDGRSLLVKGKWKKRPLIVQVVDEDTWTLRPANEEVRPEKEAAQKADLVKQMEERLKEKRAGTRITDRGQSLLVTGTQSTKLSVPRLSSEKLRVARSQAPKPRVTTDNQRSERIRARSPPSRGKSCKDGSSNGDSSRVKHAHLDLASVDGERRSSKARAKTDKQTKEHSERRKDQ
ncbi:hypothetical protein QOT17_010934 [Balamuthia mandrillaris]